MIPAQNIVAWGNVVPWADPRQVEQDLVISRALVEIFRDDVLRNALRFRGGTALNKLQQQDRASKQRSALEPVGVFRCELTITGRIRFFLSSISS